MENIVISAQFQAKTKNGGLAQLARALAWHARGHRFESGILHYFSHNSLIINELALFHFANMTHF